MDWTRLIADLTGAGMTQAEIAEACGCTQSSISDLWRGETKSPNFDLGSRLVQLHLSRCAELADQIQQPS